jgi:hypothetical protein
MSLPLRPVQGLNVILPTLPSYQSWALRDNPTGLPSLVLVEFPLDKIQTVSTTSQNIPQNTIALLNTTLQQTTLLLDNQLQTLENRINFLESQINNINLGTIPVQDIRSEV